MRHTTHWLMVMLVLVAGCSRPTDTPTPTSGPLAVVFPTFTPRSTHVAGQRALPPTVTPAPTPTPVIHIVAPGDTLLGIALHYNISLDALQAANGVLKPETLQIGQELIIPLGITRSASSSGGVLLPTPTPLPVTLQGTALYETPAGSVWVLGEALNPGTMALENTEVRVALLDASGAEVAADTAFTALDVVAAGGKSPFGVLFESPPSGVVSFQVSAVRAEASSEPGNRYLPIAIASQQSALDGLLFRVSGSIVNQGSFKASNVGLVLTTYDAAGRVTGFRRGTAGDGTLAAGASGEFEISLAPNGPPADPLQATGSLPADYALAAEGRAAQP